MVLRIILLMVVVLMPFNLMAQQQAVEDLQDIDRMVLILDASGSMWGQIDGKPKIAIARTVMAELVDELPEDLNVGLTVYGHRRKGDCEDIEMVVPVERIHRKALTYADFFTETPACYQDSSDGSSTSSTGSVATILLSGGRRPLSTQSIRYWKAL